MTNTEEWTRESEDAQLYENNYVQTLFGSWAPRVAEAAGIASGDRVLDVGCGTGILARTAAERVGSVGRETGLDLDEGMPTVARRVDPGVEWKQRDATGLPFEDATFVAVESQFALMYFRDRLAALNEIWKCQWSCFER